MKVSINFNEPRTGTYTSIRNMDVESVHYDERMGAFVLKEINGKAATYIPKENILSLSVIED